MPTIPDAWAIRNDVWNTLGDWVNNRFLIQSEGQPGGRKAPAPQQTVSTASLSMVLTCGRFRTRLFTDSAPLIHMIEALLQPMAGFDPTASDSGVSRLEIVRDTPGFTLILDGQVVRSRLPMSGVVPALTACLAMHAAGNQDIAMDAGLVVIPESSGQAFLICSSEPAARDAMTLALSSHSQAGRGRGALLPTSSDHDVESLGLPIQSSADKGEFVPASSASDYNLRSVAAVLVPSDEPIAASGGIEAIGVNEALKHLIGSCCSEDGMPLGASGFTRLSNWLESCDRYRVDMNELDAVAAALSEGSSIPSLQAVSGSR
jgi:tubulin polyglutamylase TTLL5